jgi:hypothetical protein
MAIYRPGFRAPLRRARATAAAVLAASALLVTPALTAETNACLLRDGVCVNNSAKQQANDYRRAGGDPFYFILPRPPARGPVKAKPLQRWAPGLPIHRVCWAARAQVLRYLATLGD